MVKQSRLENISSKRSKRNIVIILAGIFSLFLIFLFYGMQLLINFSLIIEKLKGSSGSDVPVNDSSYVPSPILDSPVEATNSAKINISGSALPNQEIRLFVNGEYTVKTIAGGDSIFIFRDVLLSEGNNDIKVKAYTSSDKESSYSESIHIIYRGSQPTLEIQSPQDNQTISSGDGSIRIEGRTDTFAKVTVNDYWAIVDANGNFFYTLHLQKGENTIKIAAIDDAGNKAEKEIKVKLE